MVDTSIQHQQMIQAAACAIAGGGALVFSIAGKWIGGVWTTLIAILASLLLAFHPLINATLFSNLKNDSMQRLLVALIPFTIVLIAASFKFVPEVVRVLIALVGLALILTFVYHSYAVQPDMTADQLNKHYIEIYLHRIVPLSIAVFAAWALLEPIAVRSPGPAAPMVIAVVAGGTTFLLMLSAEVQAGLMSTPISGTAVGAAVGVIIAGFIGGKSISLARGPVLMWFTVLGIMLAFRYISTDTLPLKYLLWMSSALVLAWIPEIGPLHRLKQWQREPIRLVLILIPVVMTAIIAFKAHKAEAAAEGDEDGMLWPLPQSPLVQPPAPILPRKTPIPNTIIPPTIT